MKRNETRSIASRSLPRTLAALGAAAASSAISIAALAEDPKCLSNNPADWPASSKPYFMVIVDTSGSMTTDVGVTSTCGFGSDRRAHARCAVRNTVLAYSGQVNLGLATFAERQLNCGAGCYGTCTYNCFTQEQTTTGQCLGCGPEPTNIANSADRRGAMIRVPMKQDDFWNTPGSSDNTAALLSWVDNVCTSNVEIFGSGFTPLNGALRDMKRYFGTSWSAPDASVTYNTPLATQDLAGTGVNGSTGCRSVNVILLTDGDETCDNQADANNAAADLYNNGVTVGGKLFKIRTYVINFAGGNIANTNAIAAAGGTIQAYQAQNETDLSIAFADIIAASISPESCDNKDNNCNGCTDEGFKHYCNIQPVAGQCCTLAKATCLSQYQASITPADPDGDLTLLPCTTLAEQQLPASWLCFDPKEKCDNVDNNCQSGIDEGVTKCGNPAHCPLTEACNGLDDDCDGLTDENVCVNNCVPSQEICDGCDNDCDGVADDGIAPLPCGVANPPNCLGQLTCKPAQAVPQPGGCVVGGGFNTCNNSPQTEVCDNIDNDCDGIPDDNVAPAECVPAGTDPNLVYGPNSQCKKGQQACGSMACIGFIGPSTEVCDGIDNDCDGLVDETPFGVGIMCGINQPPCSPGLTACVNGALVCQGGTPAQPEICDGIDNDCDTVVDDPPLADAPGAGANGCWNIPGNCCSFAGLTWCPPPGGSCNDVGTLTPPCSKGVLACAGASGWICQGGTTPSGEVCDGADNDCNGAADDGNLPDVGEVCGTDEGECQTGTLACNAGLLDCVGDVPPIQELCDGLDNDCDGVIDNGIPVGGTCTPNYDPMLYPNPPVFPPCQPGILQCDGMGNVICVGGLGPNPEVCDGIDNDCDGNVDEPGTPPDGTDGTEDPSQPGVKIGDACGNGGTACEGVYVCTNGTFTCQGAQQATPEECDCADNDCDGVIDNESPNNPLCSPGKDCVESSFGCGCAAPCADGEFPCPPGQECVDATINGTTGKYCFANPCGESCADDKVTDPGSGAVVCAPEGTVLDNCITPPVCVCKGQSGCQDPCFGVTCDAGLVCTSFGPNAGTCVADNCYNVPCQGCDKACHGGTCVDNPCEPSPCLPTETCKPSDDFTAGECFPSCADAMCASNEICKDGVCVPGCATECGSNQFCDTTQDPPACVDSLCTDGPTCSDGSCCDPATGQCGDCPCSGVICPEGQECKAGDCFPGEPIGSGGGGSGAGGSGAGSGTGAGPGTGGEGGGRVKGGFGLATGGGGCSCRVAQDEQDDAWLWLGAVAAALGISRRKRGRAR